MKHDSGSWKLSAAILVAVLALLPLVSTAQVKKVEDLRYPELPAFEIPTPTRVELDNGMVVILLEDHELPLIDVSLRVRTGSRLEPAEKIGLASLTGTVMRTGGTASMTGDELDDYLEGKAATVETSIGTSFGEASMSCLKEDFADVLEVFADVLRNPAFSEEKLEIARNQTNAGIARQNDDATGIMFRESTQIIYGEDSPYARDETYATVAAVTRDDLVAWHRAYFHPDRMILGLVGDFDTREVLALVKKTFGGWPRGPQIQDAEAAYKTSTTPGVYYVEKSDMTQSNIAMGHLGIIKSNPDYYAVEVMNEILSGGFGSRLFSNVRSQKSLAYAVTGSVGSSFDHHGIFRMWMTTKTETTGAAIEALLEEARNMTAKPPTDEEVAKGKAAILNSFIFNSDSRQKILNQQMVYEYYGYPLDWLARYRAGIEAVTTEQVRQAAAKYIHPDQFAILVIGPAEGRDKPLSEYGTVTAVDITIPEPEVTRVAVTAEAREKGAALLAVALEGMGGASQVDSVESVKRVATATLTTPQGELQAALEELMVYPDRLRQDVSLPFGTLTSVITPEQAFRITPQGVQPLPESDRKDSEREMRRDTLFLLRARREPGFVAAAVGTREFDGRQAEMVQVEYLDDVITLAIDTEAGVCVGMSFQGKNLMGATGEVVQTFTDFRKVDGLTYPFKVTSTFNGEPFTTATTQELTFNAEVAEEAFAAPEATTAAKEGD